MKFIVTRTSDFDGEKQPCKGAVRETVDGWNGQPEEVWTVEITTLESLLDLAKEVHYELAVSSVGMSFISMEMPQIEIVDDYRE